MKNISTAKKQQCTMSNVDQETIRGLFLNLNLAEKKCLCGKQQYNVTSQIRQVLGDMSWQQKQKDQQSRDMILLKLSFLTDLFKAKHCRWLQEISQGLKGDRTFIDSLVNLLGCGDSLVSFSSCKCLVAVTMTSVAKNEVTYFLRELIPNIKHLISATSISSLSVGQVNQVVYSLDIFTHAMPYISRNRTEDLEDSRCQIRPCMDSERIDENNNVLYNIVVEELPSLMDAFILLSTKWSEQSQLESQTLSAIASNIHTKIPNEHELTKILMAFLELLHEVFKQTLNGWQNLELIFQEEERSIFLKTLNFIWMKSLPATLLKKSLATANCVFDKILNLQKRRGKVGDEQTDRCHQLDVVPIGSEVMTHFTGEWLNRLPYTDEEHGFGGTNVMGFGDRDYQGDYCKGDYPLLRQVVRLGMATCIMMLTHKDDEDTIKSTNLCLSEISKYVTIKMGLTEDTRVSNWLLDLFGDQDDSLVLVMMRALDLYRVLEATTEDASSQQVESDALDRSRSGIFDSINPHVIFVRFLEAVTFDPNLLLDLLISNETEFLEYMVQYVHVVLTDWDGFCQMHVDVDSRRIKEDCGDGEEDQGLRDVSKNSIEDADTSLMLSDGLKRLDHGDESQEILEGVRQNSAGDAKHVDPTCVDSTIQSRSQQLGDQSHQVPNGEALDQTTIISGSNEELSHAGYQRHQVPQGEALEQIKTVSGSNEELQSRSQHLGDQSHHIHPGDEALDQMSGSNEELSHGTSASDISLQHSYASDDFITQTINQSLDDTMTVLIRLRFSIDRMSHKGVFPYNVVPLLRLLERLEDRYEL